MAGIQVVLAQYILSLKSLLPLNCDHSYLLSVLANVLSCCSKYLPSLCVTRPFPCPFSLSNRSWYWIVGLWLWSAVTSQVLSESAALPPGKQSSSLMQREPCWRGVARRETLREPGVRAEHLGLGWSCAPQPTVLACWKCSAVWAAHVLLWCLKGRRNLEPWLPFK